MSQIKIYGIASVLKPMRSQLSEVLHGCVVEALAYPKDKRAHRFFYLDHEDFYSPEGRSESYIILEFNLFEGRSTASKKRLYSLIFDRFERVLGLRPQDVEIVLIESPAHNWGIRGLPGDELRLNYKIDV
ncbi:phenylpyruvate tautomerase PptA (4-oxalocrotonate tautomerase family) [Dyadobacter jejuensis]|uniref:Phenylpyruvate tautomerase PptA (4-oxalocrotonate tautomerase family) n=1 Tax=Dyadobacter jejuensis TaxID=1082580 RepID=A0A316AE95_9BACT|nr:tautomerase family protein [Dyadobacter jejuensis]PWJ55290.1 phenylpyruvate tautomerase PptA (4-oxalocrotonate tautomerase family) [Dyadobacter jejuensis]